MLGCGIVSLSLYLGRKAVELGGGASAVTYVPIVGGLLEITALFFVWVAVLQAWRTSRPLGRERLLWLGFALALIPPVVDLGLFLHRWRP